MSRKADRAQVFSARVEKLLASPQCKPLKREEEERLILQAQRGNVDARNRVVMSHARLVATKIQGFLKRYSVKADTSLTDDMFQAALFGAGDTPGGVAHAIYKFDPARGLRFSALLQQWIFGELDTVYARCHQFGLARRSKVRRARIRAVAATLETVQGSASVEEVLASVSTKEAGLTRNVVERALRGDDAQHAADLSQYVIDQPSAASEGGGTSQRGGRQKLPPQLVDDSGPHAALLAVERSRLVEALEVLTRREQAVVAALYIEERSPNEVAAELMITPKTVRVIAAEALAKLRAELK